MIKSIIFLHCIGGPKLFQILKNNELRYYNPNCFEVWCDKIISLSKMITFCTIYLSPFAGIYLYHHNFFNAEKIRILLTYASSFVVILLSAYIMRGISRYYHKDYMEFIITLKEASETKSFLKKRQLLSSYDFEFHHWPVDFSSNSSPINNTSLQKTFPYGFFSPVIKLFSWFITSAFGRKMLYPGSIQFFSDYIFGSQLLNGRARLLLNFSAQRFKLLTPDGNYIDTVVVDKRNDTHNMKNSFLVICFEGNAGFYETGIMDIPLMQDYSVLGWNTPGFASSSGQPDPAAVINAADTVFQFALQYLNFEMKDIVLFGWSIGGFPVSWLAKTYPEIQNVILDASFDELSPLACNCFPPYLSNFIMLTIHSYLNLDIISNLKQYQGPLLLFCRLNDEVIATNPRDIFTNRSLQLLMKILIHRYPNLFSSNSIKDLYPYLSERKMEELQRSIDMERIHPLLELFKKYDSYPCSVGENLDDSLKWQLSMFLVSKYLKVLDTSHCTPLPYELFEFPWNAKSL